MKNKQLKFLMHPKTFKTILKELKGLKDDFAKVNGDTYQKYITIILDDLLDDNQKANILKLEDDNESLKLLDSYDIYYSCELT